MSRFLGSIHKKSRQLGISLLENGKEFLKGKKRTYGPGQHGNTKRKAKLSAYGVQLKEKQKVAFTYGLNEKQMRRFFVQASKQKGDVGQNFLFLLESRLDNVVFRMGLAATRRAARQLVNHKHVLVNNKRINIPSYCLQAGDTVTAKENIKNNINVRAAIDKQIATLPFVMFDKKTMGGEFTRLPLRQELTTEINEILVVE